MSHTYDKVRKKLAKCLAQMRRHDPDVTVSESPTNILYVGNSGVLCGVQWEELEAVFEPYGPIVDICVFPTGRPYSFVKFESVEKAREAFDALHGTHPSQVAKADVVFYLAFITNMPRSTASTDQEMPPGLKVVEEFVSKDEQQKLLDVVATCSNGESKGTLLVSTRFTHQQRLV
uniref:RRM domain-containing protein n=1 Tax=Plectus sambesii TaxID=2011161 RepID=A0A914W9L7_9BILA